MTIGNPDQTSFRYEGNSVTDEFLYDARVFAEGEIVVSIYTRATNAFVELLERVTHYDVELLANGKANVTITDVSKIPSGTQDILLERDIDRAQLEVLPTGTRFPAKVVETALDRLTAICQDLYTLASRAVKLPPQIIGNDPVLPVPEASKLIGWNATEDALVNYTPNDGSVLNVSAFGETLIDDVDATAARSTLGLGTLATISTISTANVTDAQITNAKLANMAANTVKVRAANSSGVPSDVALSASQLLGRGSSGDVAAITLGTGLSVSGTTLNASTANERAIFQDQKSSGTQGGGSTGATTATRVLNTTVVNNITGASLASNQVTLPAGTYDVVARAPNRAGNAHKLRLYNTTTAAYILEGGNALSHSSDLTVTDATLHGTIVIASAVLELRHYIETSRATDGLGAAVSQGTEVYSSIEFVKR
jgi:hypothetical protein